MLSVVGQIPSNVKPVAPNELDYSNALSQGLLSAYVNWDRCLVRGISNDTSHGSNVDSTDNLHDATSDFTDRLNGLRFLEAGPNTRFQR